jgi:histidinol-phosphatase (PHP family)
MKVVKNFHTHCSFCDGKNTPEEMILAAISSGFTTLGFSSHAMLPLCENGTLDENTIYDYIKEIRSLGEKYKDKIEILCGVEADYIENFTTPDKSYYKKFDLDYIIGSVHFVVTPDFSTYISCDTSIDALQEGIKKFFDGSVEKYLRAYFAAVRKMVASFEFDIIGHPDLPWKFNEKIPYFDPCSSWYKEELILTADAIAESGKITEINTGAISRGWLKEPYPLPDLRALLIERKVPLILSSDAHASSGIDCAFDRFAHLATVFDWRKQ